VFGGHNNLLYFTYRTNMMQQGLNMKARKAPHHTILYCQQIKNIPVLYILQKQFFKSSFIQFAVF